jgi:anti-anti-sigma regulatory factor
VYTSRQHGKAGLSLRGSCHGASAARELEQAVAELVATGAPFIWVDCRHLTFLNWHGQRAIFNAHQHGRVSGSVLHWCGISPAVLGQLASTGLHLLLSVLPAASYQGPAALLHEHMPSLPGRGFKPS